MNPQTQTKKKDPRAAGMPWLIPALTVRDMPKAIDFYKKAFDFEEKFVMKDEDGKLMHAEMEHNDAVIMFGQEGMKGCNAKSPASSGIEPGIGLYIYCEDVDALYERAKKAGAQSEGEPKDEFWGDRMVALKDLDGYRWMFATNVREFDPSKVPQGQK